MNSFLVAAFFLGADNGDMEGIPRELDWVKARAACSLEQVFSELYHGVVQDVKDANVVLPPSPRNAPFEVLVSREGEDFTVQRSESLKCIVSFVLLDEHIAVSSTATGEKWQFTVGLNDEGRCLLRENGQEFEQWQVRRKALEGLFFQLRTSI